MKHILLCVAGLTPQIVTETLYALTQQRGEPVDEIRIITTLDGRDRVMSTLLTNPAQQEGKFFDFCRDFGIAPERIAFSESHITLLQAADKTHLTDIRSLEDNESAANQICEVVRELTKDASTQLHASAAGGRKTLSIYLTAAMQLFGRQQDRLSHVLVSPDELETTFGRSFYYIAPGEFMDLEDRAGKLHRVETSKLRIDLADIPFIRLRGLVEGWKTGVQGNHSSLVDQGQENLNLLESANDLVIDLKKRTVQVGRHTVKLTEREFFGYLLFLRKYCAGQASIRLEDMTPEYLESTREHWETILGKSEGEISIDLFSSRFNDFFKMLLSESKSTSLSAKESYRNSFIEMLSKIKRQFLKKGIPDRYLFIADHTTSTAREYKIGISLDQIIVFPAGVSLLDR
ncbi:MAG: TIGR02584 family CRISPR-associated protein [Acidobacteria bacterium]|nr:TIGR02584 family CRISPR-associated protein [Acidobacteriota bacterium]